VVRASVILGLLLLLALPSAAAPAVPQLVPHLPTREDRRAERQLARLGIAFHGWVGLFVQDLRTGRYAGWNEDAALPAASMVKLGVMAEGIRRFGFGPASPLDGDLRAIGRWSSNIAANRVFARVGGVAPTEAALRRLGMFSSTYPGPYVEDEDGPPRRLAWSGPADNPHWRVTTARDLARALFRLQAAAAAQRWAVRTTGLSARSARAMLSYLALAAPQTSLFGLAPDMRRAEKDGWVDDVRASAAIVYAQQRPRIVVVLAYRPDKIDAAEARELGRRVALLHLR
jgi:beta-lactamase class A